MVVNQTVANPQMQQVVTIYNGAMGLIGVYHAGKGVVNFAKSLPDATKNLLRENKSLRDALTAEYIKWKELTTNLDNLTPAEKELIAKQEQVWRILGVAENTGINSIDNIIDEATITLLSKEIKYLPGPQLPQKVAETFDNLLYVNRKLVSNEKFYKYHGIDNRTGKKYAWYTNKKYTTELELRQKLAIREDWDIKIEYITEFDVPSGTWVSEGKAASQGVGYPDQDYQVVILNTPTSWIIRTDKAFK